MTERIELRAAPTGIAPGSFRAWVTAIRPATLPVGAAPVVVGAAAASAWLPHATLAVFAALMGSLFLQIGANLANDFYDFEKGADTEARVGPVRAAQAGLLSPAAIRAGAFVSFALAFVTGIYLVYLGGLPIVVIGLASIAAGIAYTGGPYPLGYHGLGDICVFVFFGPVAVCTTSMLAGGTIGAASALAAVTVGLLATAVLVVNNLRDEGTDRVAGKRTLIVRFGRTFGVVEYVACVGVAIVAVVGVAIVTASPWPLVGALGAPLGVRLAAKVAKTRGAEMNPLLVGTARLTILSSVLLAVGLLLARHFS